MLLGYVTRGGHFVTRRLFASQAREMAEHRYAGNSLQEILERLQKWAPLTLASTWDNVGLLVDPMSDAKINTIMLTNDLTEDIVQEAVKAKSGLIISYHPNIFQGLKSVSQKTWKERIVVQCIKNNIAVFSPHTAWDAVEGGVNDWLGGAFSVASGKAIMQMPDNPKIGPGRFLNLTERITVKKAVELVKKQTGVSHVRLALAKNKSEEDLISTVALCAGSGNSVLTGVEADLYLTGEMFHHDILDATQKGIHVILCNHSDSERGFLRQFQGKLEEEVLKGEAKVIVSKLDRDPLTTV